MFQNSHSVLSHIAHSTSRVDTNANSHSVSLCIPHRFCLPVQHSLDRFNGQFSAHFFVSSAYMRFSVIRWTGNLFFLAGRFQPSNPHSIFLALLMIACASRAYIFWPVNGFCRTIVCYLLYSFSKNYPNLACPD